MGEGIKELLVHGKGVKEHQSHECSSKCSSLLCCFNMAFEQNQANAQYTGYAEQPTRLRLNKYAEIQNI